MELSLPGTFVPWNFRSRERKFQELGWCKMRNAKVRIRQGVKCEKNANFFRTLHLYQKTRTANWRRIKCEMKNAKIRKGLPRVRALNEGGVGKNWRFSTNKPPYLRNGARYDNRYY